MDILKVKLNLIRDLKQDHHKPTASASRVSELTLAYVDRVEREMTVFKKDCDENVKTVLVEKTCLLLYQYYEGIV